MSIYREDIAEYLKTIAPEEDAILAEISSEALEITGAPALSANEGKFLYLMAKLIGAQKILELGTGLGYSTIWLARALPDIGKLVTIEREEQFSRIAAAHFQKLNKNVIELIESEASPVLEEMDDQFDMCFMDEYKAFYFLDLDKCVKLLRPGGLFLAHNALEGGWVPRGQIDIESPELKDWHKLVLSHPQLETMIAPIGEGFVLARKRDK